MTAVHATHLILEPVPAQARALILACPSPLALLSREGDTLRLHAANSALLKLVGMTLTGLAPEEIAAALVTDLDDGRDQALRERVGLCVTGAAMPDLKVLGKRMGLDVLLEARFASLEGLAAVFFTEAQSRDSAKAARHDPDLLQRAVFELSRASHETPDLDALFERIHQVVERLIGTTNFYIALGDEREHMLRFPYSKDEFDAGRTDRRIGLGATDIVYLSGKPLLMDRTLANQMLQAGTLVNYGVPAQVWLGVPLIVTGKTIGVMAVQDYRNPDFIGEAERQILSFISDQIASAIALKQAQEDARSARADAEKASQSKGDFLAIMSHELRSPLSVIIGFSDLLQENLAGTNEARQAASIGEAGQRLLSAVNQILDFSKVDAFVQPVNEEIVELDEVFALSRAFFASSFDEKRLAFSIVSEGYVPTCIRTDGRIVQQILTHLLGNAVKYTPAGGRISIGVRADPAGFGPESLYHLQVSVEDTGCGIPAEKIPRLFEPFEQLHRPSPGEGAGLGLATSRRLAELLGGRLTVQSTENEGTVFTMIFSAKAATKSGTEPTAPSPTEHVERLLRSRLRGDDSPMLIVDAFPDSRAVLAGFVESITGRTTLVTGGAREAITLCRERQPHLILIDAHEPDVDGPALCRQLRADPVTFGHPFVVILSVDHSPAFVRRCTDAEANAYLPKPMSRRALGQAILAAADSRVGSRSGSRPGFKVPERFSATS